MTKDCIECLENKPLAEFHIHRGHRDGLRNDCIQCVSKKNSARYVANRDKIRAQTGAYYAANRERRKPVARAAKLRAYGLDGTMFARLMAGQDGKCACCAREIGEGANIDHDHDTGEVRGILCGPCNRGIGLLQDSSDILRRAADYLDAPVARPLLRVV